MNNLKVNIRILRWHIQCDVFNKWTVSYNDYYEKFSWLHWPPIQVFDWRL